MSAISAASRFSSPFASAFINTKPHAFHQDEMHVLKTNTLSSIDPSSYRNAPVWQSKNTNIVPTYGMAAHETSPWYLQYGMAATTPTKKISTGALMIIGLVILTVVYFGFISKHKK